MERRTFLVGGAALASTVAGCLGDGGDNDGDDGDDGDGSSSSDGADVDLEVDPTVTDLRYPEPQAVSTNAENQGGDSYQFSVTVENTGMEGDIRMTLVFLEERDTSIWSVGAEEVNSFQRFYSDGERRTETYSAELTGDFEAYGFRLVPTQAECDVRNDGGSGSVEVRLLQSGGVGDGTIIESKRVDMGADVTRTVSFAIDPSFVMETDIDGIQLEAEAQPASVAAD